jgi:hypothetical protein
MAQPVYRVPLEEPQQPGPVAVPASSLAVPASPKQAARMPEAASEPKALPPANQYGPAARAIGSATGKAARALRQLPQRFFALKAGAFPGNSGPAGSEQGPEEELTGRARRRFERVQSSAGRLSQDHPLETIAAAGGAGLMLGVALGLWRNHGTRKW